MNQAEESKDLLIVFTELEFLNQQMTVRTGPYRTGLSNLIHSYALPNKSNVSITVFDLLGRQIKTLVNEFNEAGYYTVSFDGTGLASGVYFYTIEVRQAGSLTGNFKDSKKMVLIK